MATQGAWLGASRRLILSFVLALLVPAAAVVWLGVRLIEQDRALASRQLRVSSHAVLTEGIRWTDYARLTVPSN